MITCLMSLLGLEESNMGMRGGSPFLVCLLLVPTISADTSMGMLLILS